MIDLNYKLMGQRLRAIRKKLGLTQEQVAEKAEISPQHYSGMETGGVKVSLPALIRIANVLNASMDELLLDSILSVTKPGLKVIARNSYCGDAQEKDYVEALSRHEVAKTVGPRFFHLVCSIPDSVWETSRFPFTPIVDRLWNGYT